MEWLTCFSIVNLMFGCLSFKSLKNLLNLAAFRKQLECHQNISDEI